MATEQERFANAVEIGRLNTAYAQSKLLHSAVEVGVFELLAEGPASLKEIEERLELHPRLLRDFCDGLVALGLLEREDGTYRNSAKTEQVLLKDSPLYLGSAVLTASSRHLPMWGKLTEALRDGLPKAAGAAGPDVFLKLYENKDAARKFLAHMDSAHATVGPQLAQALDWSRYSSFIDVGGARGNVAAAIAQAHPHLTGGVFELPAVEPLFDEHVERLGLANRVFFHSGDFFEKPMPQTDVVILGHVLHDWALEERRTLLKRAFEAVRPGGALVIYDQMLDEEDPNLFSVLGSLNVALVTPGSEYTVAECRELVAEVGFQVVSAERILTTGSDLVLVAEKAG
ncbi:acetylserotonin O-methyltransferase (plasmid) [Streptomyces sp. NBC_00435]|uniref:methyltransferase n=1 Tax=Streptomyces sp. NBC_00435 TaxID=2903649 RepID=UPI002E23EDBE